MAVGFGVVQATNIDKAEAILMELGEELLSDSPFVNM